MLAQRFLQATMVLAGVTLLFSLTGCTQATSVKDARLASAPVLDSAQTQLDFDYPSRPPSLKQGKEIFVAQCAACHAPSFFQQPKVQKDFLYTTPIDLYILLTTGKAPALKQETTTRKAIVLAGNHPSFRDKLSRDERWAVLFYARHLAGGSDIQHAATGNDPDIAAVYGANCAVCHGKKGHANGPLHTGHPSKHELQGGKVHTGLFFPAPARFTQYDRLFNRTDAQLFQYLVEGIYPSGMPAWLGNQDKDQGFIFDETLLWMLVKHVRVLALTPDLDVDEPTPAGLVPSKADEPVIRPLIPPVTKVVHFDYRGKHTSDYFDNQKSNMSWVNGSHQ